MKKLRILIATVVIAGISAVSCSSDDDGGAVSGSIERKWNPTKTTVKVGSDTFTQNYADNEVGCSKDYIEFAAANVLNRVVYNRNVDTNECESVNGTPATWARDENTLTITGGQYEGTYEIVKLNGSELRIEDESTAAGVTTTTTVYFNKAAN
jgi:hypothetical protein